jgi:TubC N-terminal docking domain
VALTRESIDAECAAQGVTLALKGQQLHVRGGPPTPELREALKANKAWIIGRLRGAALGEFAQATATPGERAAAEAKRPLQTWERLGNPDLVPTREEGSAAIRRLMNGGEHTTPPGMRLGMRRPIDIAPGLYSGVVLRR